MQGCGLRAAGAASARPPAPRPQLLHFSGQCFLRFASKNLPSNYLPARAHRGTLPTSAPEKKGTDGSFIAHLEMFPRLLFSSPIHPRRIPPICQLESPEAAAGGPGTPRAPARGRALAVRRAQPQRGPGSGDAGCRGRRGLRTNSGAGAHAAPTPSCILCLPRRVWGRQEQLQRAGCTRDASTPDAAWLPLCGVGEEPPGCVDFRARRSFPAPAGTLGVGAGGDGGSRRGAQGAGPTTGFFLAPLPRADVRLRKRRLALCLQQG